MAAVEVFDRPDVVVAARALVGEGPVWDARADRLCWVDLLGGEIHEHDAGLPGLQVSALGTMVGAIAPRRDADGFAVAVADGFGYWAGGDLTVADPVLPEPQRRMNDAKCDSRGRLWAGSTHLDFVPGAGSLHRWDGGTSVQVGSGFTLPNGLGWSPDDTTMYLADSMTHQLLSAPYRPEEGETGEFTVLCPIGRGLPDGLAVDADGCLWVAIWDGSQVRRFSPAGDLIGIVPMPVSRPTSCAFGPDGTLYITSAAAGLEPAQLAQQPYAGSVFALATRTTGLPVPMFEG